MDFTSLNAWLAGSLQGSIDVSGSLTLDNWTEAELYQYAEEALHDIGARLLIVAEHDNTSIALAANQAIYDLPSDHIVTVFAAADNVNLTAASVTEMEALDDDWTEAAAASATQRWVGNVEGLGRIGFYPPKNAAGVVDLVYQKRPPDMPAPAIGQPLNILLPAPVADYLVTKSLEQARMRQGDGQMLDAAGAFTGLSGLYERVMAAYWGMGE